MDRLVDFLIESHSACPFTSLGHHLAWSEDVIRWEAHRTARSLPLQRPLPRPLLCGSVDRLSNIGGNGLDSESLVFQELYRLTATSGYMSGSVNLRLLHAMPIFYSIFRHRTNIRKDLKGLPSKRLTRMSSKVAAIYEC